MRAAVGGFLRAIDRMLSFGAEMETVYPFIRGTFDAIDDRAEPLPASPWRWAMTAT